MRLLITCFLLLNPLLSYSQKCVVSNAREGIVYIGISNPLDIAAEGYKCKDIIVITDNGKVETTDNDCSYSLYPTNAGVTHIILIERKSKKQLGKLPFRVEHIPDPVAMIAGKQGGAITKSIMEVQIGISAVLLGFDFDARFMVTGFTVSIIRKGKSLYTEECSSAMFTGNTKNAFNTLEDGDEIVFSNITCKSPDRRTRRLQPIEFIISNS